MGKLKEEAALLSLQVPQWWWVGCCLTQYLTRRFFIGQRNPELTPVRPESSVFPPGSARLALTRRSRPWRYPEQQQHAG